MMLLMQTIQNAQSFVTLVLKGEGVKRETKEIKFIYQTLTFDLAHYGPPDYLMLICFQLDTIISPKCQ